MSLLRTYDSNIIYFLRFWIIIFDARDEREDDICVSDENLHRQLIDLSLIIFVRCLMMSLFLYLTFVPRSRSLSEFILKPVEYVVISYEQVPQDICSRILSIRVILKFRCDATQYNAVFPNQLHHYSFIKQHFILQLNKQKISVLPISQLVFYSVNLTRGEILAIMSFFQVGGQDVETNIFHDSWCCNRIVVS